MGARDPQPDLIHGGIGIIHRAGCYLIRQRPKGTVYAGYWEFPGGKCEPGETPEQTTIRECREETGLDVIPRRLRRVVEHTYPHGRVRLAFFDCEPRDPSAEPEASHGCRWVHPHDLGHFRFPEANEEILAELTAGSAAADIDTQQGDSPAQGTGQTTRD
jgi:mutator protein MutT